MSRSETFVVGILLGILLTIGVDYFHKQHNRIRQLEHETQLRQQEFQTLRKQHLFLADDYWNSKPRKERP